MKFLDILSEAYYTGNPLVSNELFDELAKKYNYNKVGAFTSDAKYIHAYPMRSLQKVYPGDKLPFQDTAIKTPKLDGAAVSIYYVGGKVVGAATRGDGKKGQDITDKMRTLVPLNIGNVPDLQVTGEVVTTIGKENLRNYASGALNLKDINEFKTRELYFIAYDLVPNVFDTYTETLDFLETVGFKTVRQAGSEFPTDGWVVRVDSNVTFENLGNTAKHPRGAYAMKENKEGVTTTLRVIWDVGRSGVVTPVAIFDPVDVDGATVSRATLHNWKYIQELDLEKDCTIEVIRAGDIIPRVMGRVYD